MDSHLVSPVLNGLASLSSSLVAVLCFVLIGHGQGRGGSANRFTAYGWWAALSLAGGSGLWASQFVSLGSLNLPWQQSFQPTLLLADWILAVAGLGGVLGLARLSPRGGPLRLAAQALTLSLLWTLVHLLARESLELPPLQPLQPPWLASGLVLLASGLGFGLALSPRAAVLGRFEWRLWLSAGMFGLFCGMAQEMALGSLLFDGAGLPAWPGAFVDPSMVWVLSGAATLLLTLGLFGALADVQARHRQATLSASLSDANDRLREQALADPLTRLPNRLLFEERLEQALLRAPDTGTDVLAVMFVDLDGFKPINDSFGHAAGDRVLAEVGRRLQAIAGDQDLAARVGGDEFLLLIDLGGGAGRASLVAQSVLRALNEPFALPNRVEVNLSCSVGIVTYPSHGPGHKLIANADAAMYAAKRAGGSTYAFFEPSMDLDARLQLALQHDLRAAIENQELELYYQPKVHALSGQITGAEALVRWNHPTRGMIMPGVFIPVAERFALISPLGYWVIEEACRQIAAWMAEGLRMRLAVNLSMHQLRQDDLVPRIQASLNRHHIDPSLLTFEVTESVAMEDATVRALGALSGVGVSLSIDDFGTAYSNFAALRKLPAKQLKIDRSLFADIHESGDALAVVDAMIKMAHALGLKVVAEGVETEQQRDLLLALNCDEFQGYLYARPMSAHMLSLWALDEGETHPVDFRPSLYASAESFLH